MANDRSGIEWTDATWNPTTGCSRVSEGCRHCYAEALSHRFGVTVNPWTRPHAAENVRLHPERLDQPLRWRRPRRVFVDSMSDLFHDLVPDPFIDRVFAVMAMCPQHTFQVLTKRPRRMARHLGDLASSVGTRPNVWLGTSVEDQRAADERIPPLLATPAAVRFLSCEPLLGPLDLTGWLGACPACGGAGCPDGWGFGRRCRGRGLDWVIAGGESGPEHRPLDLDWARSLRDQCGAAGAPFFFKQIGGRTSKAGGRLLDGRTWDEFPEAMARNDGAQAALPFAAEG